jgi:hypothetical protein
MVEYFGEQLDGYAFSQFGWVQSYGSRCVKPPILFGDISRPRHDRGVDRLRPVADRKPMKGMLTGPVTILNWSFVRDDQPRAACRQLALAIRAEVLDLEAGVRVIQIDEAALREGLPLRRRNGGIPGLGGRVFRITANGVRDETQIHTHMCYSEFNDIMAAIAAMDADVITIETSRSDMELLDAFEDFQYPNEIGPGVYDIHSPNIPRHSRCCAHEKSSRADSCGAPVGQPGLRAEDPPMGRGGAGADRDGGCCQGVARRQQLSTRAGKGLACEVFCAKIETRLHEQKETEPCKSAAPPRSSPPWAPPPATRSCWSR